MSFKENLLKKIKIDKLTKKVLDSIGPPDSGLKGDKETMKNLLEMSAYEFKKERDIDLYTMALEGTQAGPEMKKILVLDNELSIYNTTVEDVGLRKSPTVKEMLNIGNVIKILKDTDVLVSKKKESVKTVQNDCIDLLDLSYDESDLNEIENDGVKAMEIGDTDGVIESISLFAELLGYKSPPKAFTVSNHEIVGALTKSEDGKVMFGPVVIYSITDNVIKLIEDPIPAAGKEKIKLFHKVVRGEEKASAEGAYAFQYLNKSIVKRKG